MQKEKRYSFFKDTFQRLMKNKLAIIGLIVITLLAFSAIFADIIAPHDYRSQNLRNILQSPSAEHLFGTDEFGRDILSRVLYGTRISLMIGFIAVSISVIVGGILGSVAGYYGRFVDNAIMRCMDVLLAVPPLLLAIAIIAALGPGIVNLMIATGISTIPNYSRIVRASVLSIKDQEFIEAAKAVGTNDFFIIVKHILPNCVAPIIVQATFGVAIAILTAAGLSFIGLGVMPPTPEWGAMLSSGRMYIRDHAYMTIFPGIAIATTIFSLNVLGDGLRDALDPKLRS